MTDHTSFFDDPIGAIKDRCPELDGHSLILDRRGHYSGMTAIAAAMEAADPEFAAKAQAQVDELRPMEIMRLDDNFAEQKPFTVTLNLEPDTLPPVTLVNPLFRLTNTYDPKRSHAVLVPWHADLAADRSADAIAQEASRHMQFAAWHEVGHAVADARGHDAIFKPLEATTPDLPEADRLDRIAIRNADEQYADGFSLRQIGSENPSRGLATALEMADLRAVNSMAGFIQRQEALATAYSTDNAITAAIQNISGYSAPGKQVRDPGPDVIAEQTWDAVSMGRLKPEAIAELLNHGRTIPEVLKEQGEHGLAHHLGQVGKTAETAPTYYFARNYMAAMDRLLPDDHPMRPSFGQAGAAIATNPQAPMWDQQNPPVHVAVIAAQHQLRLTARKPAPTTAPTLSRRAV
ncbi:MAG: hypothetical protein AAF213_12800 [Pseudomonadota bacterium]